RLALWRGAKEPAHAGVDRVLPLLAHHQDLLLRRHVGAATARARAPTNLPRCTRWTSWSQCGEALLSLVRSATTMVANRGTEPPRPSSSAAAHRIPSSSASLRSLSGIDAAKSVIMATRRPHPRRPHR